MTVFKYFIKIALRNKWIILAYATIFFILAIAISSDTEREAPDFLLDIKLNIGIIDNSHSELSDSLKNYLIKRNNIIEIIPDEEYIKEQIFLEAADAIIVIPENFEERVINKQKSVEIYRDDRKMESIQVQNQINRFLIFANATYKEGKFDLKEVNLALNEKAEIELIKKDDRIRNDSVNEWFRSYYNFAGYIIMAIYIAIMGIIMADFNNDNIKNRGKISPKKSSRFNAEIYLGQLTIAAVITSVFAIGSIVLKGKYIEGIDLSKYIINVTVFSFSILSLTFLINSIFKHKFVISGLSTVLSLGTAFISGVMVPQQLLGDKILTIAKFFPTYYFVKINDMQIGSLPDIKHEILMQLLFAGIFLLAGFGFSGIKQRAR